MITHRTNPLFLALAAFSALSLGGCGLMDTPSTYEDAQSAFEDRQYRIASAHIADLISNDEADDRVRVLQAELMLVMGDGNRAMAAIEQLPAAVLGGAERRIATAHAQNLQGAFDKTAVMYQSLPADEYTEQDFRMLLWALRESGDLVSFAEGMDVALDLFPDSAHLNALAAEQLLDIGLPEQASEFAIAAFENGSDIYEVRLTAGRMAIAENALADALGHYEEASRINPSRPAPFATIARLHLDADRIEAAGEVLRFAIEQHPGYALLQWQMGRYQLACGDVPSARAAAERVRRDFIDNPEFVLLIAEIEAASGNTALALDSYRRYIRKVGEVPEVMAKIAELEG